MTNVETVERIYQAFGRGDVAFMVDRFRDDAVIEPWSTTAVESGRVPYYRRREGKAGARDFYASMDAVELRSFAHNGLLSGSDHVAALVSIEFTVKATGVTVRDEEIQLWTFDREGLVVSLQHYGDTAKHIAANGA